MIEGFQIADGGARERPGGVLLVHGFTGSPHEMRALGESLAEAGYVVLGVRLPGHGNPEQPEPNEWPAWQAAVDEGFAALADAAPGVELAAVGLSMGALLVFQLAVRKPEKLRAVVALSPAIRLPFRARLALDLARRSRYLRKRFALLPKGASDIRDPVARQAHPRIDPFALSAALSFGELQRLTPAILIDVKQPLLIVHSRRDRTCLVRGALRLGRMVGSSDIELHVLERSGHVITVDLEREKVTRLVLSFLGRKLSAATGAATLVASNGLPLLA